MNKLTLFLILACSAVNSFASDAADELGQKWLNAMGGQQAWANVKAVHSHAVNHHPGARLPYIQEYWYFTDAPRHIVKINNHDMNRMRGYTVDGGWSMLRGETHAFDAERLERELQSWHRSIYRKLILLARNSEALELSIGTDGRLEFAENGEFMGWLIIDESGAPLRHGGTESSDSWTDFGALLAFDDVYWPQAGHDDSGWRFELLSIGALETLPEMSNEPPIPISNTDGN